MTKKTHQHRGNAGESSGSVRPCARQVRPPRRSRRGQALVEFAIIAFVLAGMVAGLLGILVLALSSFQNNIATENAGRVLDEHHLLIEQNFREHFDDSMDSDYFDPGEDFENVTARQVYRFLNEYELDGDSIEDNSPVLYSERLLILSPDDYRAKVDPRTDLALPELNQSLLGQYVFDPDLIPAGETERGAYRFPGAVVTRTTGSDTYQTVMIPLLPDSTADDGDGTSAPHGIERSFHVTSSNDADFYPVSNDWVAPVVIGKEQNDDGLAFRVIMFHPSQPASTISIVSERDAQGRRINQRPIDANDDAVDSLIGDPPDGYVLTPPASTNPQYGASSSRGEFGLGESYAFGTKDNPNRKVRPFRAVFETSSLFRVGATTFLAKYEADAGPVVLEDESLLNATQATTDTPVAPFVAYEDNDDQSLNLEGQVLDKFSEDLRLYFVDPILPNPPASDDNDFVRHVLRLRPNDDGVWRINVSADFRVYDDPAITTDDNDEWVSGHELELRLYRNGAFDRLIARQVVDEDLLDQSIPIPTVALQNDVLVKALAGDVLQVRVYSQRPATDPDDPTGPAPDYEVAITGTSESNWVSFERIGD